MSTEPKGKPPTHGVYITPQEGKKGRWQKIGVAWMHKDTRGATIILDALPVSGRAVLREFGDEVADGGDTGESFNEAANGGQQ